jgi:hypothetical protein
MQSILLGTDSRLHQQFLSSISVGCTYHLCWKGEANL